MTVYFIGAGPGAADLITLRGARLLGACGVVLYAGSLVPEALLEHARPGAEVHNTAGLDLEAQTELYRDAQARGLDVARLHSGDPAIYGATAEQMRALDRLGVAYEVVPGVSSFTASAAVLGAELTRPEVTQTIILTRASGRASRVPDTEALAELARHRCTLCVFLSGPQLPDIARTLLEHYPPHTPLALVQRASQPEERVYRGTLAGVLDDIAAGTLRVSEWALTTMLTVSPALSPLSAGEAASQLYSADYAHRFRRARKDAAADGGSA